MRRYVGLKAATSRTGVRVDSGPRAPECQKRVTVKLSGCELCSHLKLTMTMRVTRLYLLPAMQPGKTHDKIDSIAGRGLRARTRRNDDRQPRASRRNRFRRLAPRGRSGRCRRQSSVRLSRQTLLLVPGRMARSGLVPVRLSLAPRFRLGRSHGMARLARTGPPPGCSPTTPTGNPSADRSSTGRSSWNASAGRSYARRRRWSWRQSGRCRWRRSRWQPMISRRR